MISRVFSTSQFSYLSSKTAEIERHEYSGPSQVFPVAHSLACESGLEAQLELTWFSSKLTPRVLSQRLEQAFKK